MKPGSFDPETSREMVGHDRALVIEKKAREDAESGTYDPPPKTQAKTYWDECQNSFELVVYYAQYVKRLAKIEKASGENQPVNQEVLDIVKSVIAANTVIVTQFMQGKEKAVNILIGLVLKATKEKGIANVDARNTAVLIRDVIANVT